MFDFLKVLFYIAVVAASLGIGELVGTEWLFYTAIIWGLILLYCFIRFGILEDDNPDK